MYEDDTWKPVASHKTLPCFKRFTEMGTYFGGGYIILGLANFTDPDALFSMSAHECVVTINADLNSNEEYFCSRKILPYWFPVCFGLRAAS